MASISFVAYGVPVPQGSTRAFVVKDRGTGKPRAAVTSDNASLGPWRQTVSWAAREALPEGFSPIEGPVSVRACFTLPKPRSAPKKKRTWPTRKPDLDKLMRAVFDALTDAGVWADDSQVVRESSEKCYPGEGEEALGRPGVRVWIEEVLANDR